MRIFIINNFGHDFSQAQKLFDEEVTFINLTTGIINPFNTDRLLAVFEKKLKQFDFCYKKDYIIISGSPILVGLFFMSLHKYVNYDRLNLLLYDMKQKRYKLREV